MPVWLTVVLALGGSALISTIIGFVTTRVLNKIVDKRDKEKEEQDNKIRKDKEELERFRYNQGREESRHDMKTIVDESLKTVNLKLLDLEKRFDNVDSVLEIHSEANLSSLRNDILNFYYACVAKGYRSDEDYTNMDDMYHAYTRLDGNSFVEDKIKEFKKLPTKEQYKKKLKEQEEKGGNN